MRYAKDARSRQLYTEFLTRHERCNFQQSLQWAAVKSNWKNEIVLAEDEQGNIIGGLSVLIRKIPLFGNLMYSPRGPICDPDDADALRQLTEGAELLAWKYNVMALRMEPDVSEEDSPVFRRIMEDLGWQIRDRVRSCRDVIQPRTVFRLDIAGKTQEQLFEGFSRKVRYNIRQAQRQGVTVREGTREDLAVFHRMLAETGRRDGFLVRPLEYYQRVWDAFGPENICLLLAWYEGRPIAGAIPIHYGNKTWYAFGASDDEHRHLTGGYLLQWEMIRRAAARGDAVYDLRGVLESTDPSNGLYFFKSRFGATLTRFIGEVTMPYQPVKWRLYRLAERLYMDGRERWVTLRHRMRRQSAPEPVHTPTPLPQLLPPHGGNVQGHISAETKRLSPRPVSGTVPRRPIFALLTAKIIDNKGLSLYNAGKINMRNIRFVKDLGHLP